MPMPCLYWRDNLRGTQPQSLFKRGKKNNIQRQGVLHHCQVLDVAIKKKKKLHPILTSD